MSLLAMALGVVSAVAGAWASHLLDLPTGPLIVLAQILLFGGALLARR
jgi:ABC-type Mn2+/Zn2+ transport system permease subunit